MTQTLTEYSQAGDSLSAGDPQILSIQTVDCGAGSYVILETDRWAVDSEEEINELADKLKAALKVKVI